MKQLIDGGMYKRERSGFLGLLCFLLKFRQPPPLTNGRAPEHSTLPNIFCSETAPIAKRLMIGVQGASYNHNHCNGMAMELYGCGAIQGIDAEPAQLRAPDAPQLLQPVGRTQHVVAAGSSSSVPFSGSAGQKNIGHIDLAAMEPMPDQDAVSPDYSFSDTRYFDQSTGTNESRTLAVIRTSGETGYYVDIYRSDNSISNDYVYHNIGDKVTFLNEKREPLQTVSTTYPLTGKDYTGFRFYTDVQKLDNYTGNLIARFSAKNDQDENIFLQALIAGNTNRTYYQAFSPKSKSAGKNYYGKDLPYSPSERKPKQKATRLLWFLNRTKAKTMSIASRLKSETTAIPSPRSPFSAKTDKRSTSASRLIPPNRILPEPVRSRVFRGGRLFRQKLTSIYLGKGTEMAKPVLH
jgi:hypothetical protein